jgi:hypothetical protein
MWWVATELACKVNGAGQERKWRTDFVGGTVEKPGGWDLGEEGRWRNGSGWGRTVLGGSNNAIASKKIASSSISVKPINKLREILYCTIILVDKIIV